MFTIERADAQLINSIPMLSLLKNKNNLYSTTLFPINKDSGNWGFWQKGDVLSFQTVCGPHGEKPQLIFTRKGPQQIKSLLKINVGDRIVEKTHYLTKIFRVIVILLNGTAILALVRSLKDDEPHEEFHEVILCATRALKELFKRGTLSRSYYCTS